MEPEEACFPGFDEEDFTAPLTTKQARKEDIGLKKEEPLVRLNPFTAALVAKSC